MLIRSPLYLLAGAGLASPLGALSMDVAVWAAIVIAMALRLFVGLREQP